MRSYPRREAFFAHRFCRLLTKSAAAQMIGPEGFCLLAIIVHQEDAKRYTGAVSFWNAQLAPLCGFQSEDRLARVRSRCIEAGWLHYEKGAKGKPGKYWCLIPEEFTPLDDSPTDETETPPQNATAKRGGKRGESERSDNFPPQNAGESAVNPRAILPSPYPYAKCNALQSSLKGPPQGLSNPPEATPRIRRSAESPRWCPRFHSSEFRDLSVGAQRFARAVQAGVVRDVDELRFLTLWRNVGRRHAEGHVRSPGAVFLKCLRESDWSGSEDDEQDAKAFLQESRFPFTLPAEMVHVSDAFAIAEMAGGDQ